MSITKGNEYLRNGELERAIKEYEKVEKNTPLHKIAQQNIERIKNKTYSIDTIDIQKSVENNLPLVSVIIPVFNVAPYLDASILSVRGQSYKNLEIIIVNDASTDESIQIIRMHEKLDKRIKVINLEFNTLGGAGIPSNIGIDHAKGKYVAFADSDDILEIDAIEKMVKLAEKNESEIIIADFCNFSEDDREIKTAYDKDRWKGLPLNKNISSDEYSSLFRLSPVPWRKLYLRSFLNKHFIRFPEGDYFYEDNPLHWFVLSMAEKISLLDYVVAYHRMGREGQTMGSDSYKLASMILHLNTIKSFLLSKNIKEKKYWIELLDFVYRTTWIIEKQTDTKISKLIKKRFYLTALEIYNKSNVSKDDILKIRPNFFKRFEEYNQSYKDIDLTIIIPVFNCEDMIENTLNSVLELKKTNITFDILIMDDGSTDSTYNLLKKYEQNHDNIFVLKQKNKGAGVARNMLIPLITGKYTYFLDADDEIESKNLYQAFLYSLENNLDLCLFKYKIHFYEENKYQDMWNADKNNFNLIRENKNIEYKKKYACKLVNYPWNRIIRTLHLHDKNIFFGKTVVHNDIPYHWNSIVSANSIDAYDDFVCIHKKFNNREQITNISDTRRMAVIESLRFTHSIIKKYPIYKNIYNDWISFSQNLLKWAEERIPKEYKEKYHLLSNNLINKMLNSYNIDKNKLKEKLLNQINIKYIESLMTKEKLLTKDLLYLTIYYDINILNTQINNNLLQVIKNKILPEEILMKDQSKLEANINQQLIKILLIYNNVLDKKDIGEVLKNLNYLNNICIRKSKNNTLNKTTHIKLILDLIDYILKESK